MLKLYDPLEDYLNEFNRQKNVVELRYYASDVIESLGLIEDKELQIAVNRALNICSSLHISIDENFRTIYRFNGNNLITDWKISTLACYLITINANPSNRKVAEAQLFFIIKNLNNVKI